LRLMEEGLVSLCGGSLIGGRGREISYCIKKASDIRAQLKDERKRIKNALCLPGKKKKIMGGRVFFQLRPSKEERKIR